MSISQSVILCPLISRDIYNTVYRNIRIVSQRQDDRKRPSSMTWVNETISCFIHVVVDMFYIPTLLYTVHNERCVMLPNSAREGVGWGLWLMEVSLGKSWTMGKSRILPDSAGEIVEENRIIGKARCAICRTEPEIVGDKIPTL